MGQAGPGQKKACKNVAGRVEFGIGPGDDPAVTSQLANALPAPAEVKTAPAQAVDPHYRVGTLEYTKAGLVSLFAWMLWGDFCITLMETAWPKIVPLQLQDAGASNLMMGLLAGSFPAVVNFFVNPVFSYRSDRFRSRWGRRIPFLFLATPVVSGLLALFGYADALAAGLQRVLAAAGLETAPLAVFLVFFGVLIAVFQVFNVVVSSAYPYLFRDVLPAAFMGRFNALLRMVSTAAAFVFHTFVFGHAGDHRREIYLGAAALYFLAFMLLCWRVREGELSAAPSGGRQRALGCDGFGEGRGEVSLAFNDSMDFPTHIHVY